LYVHQSGESAENRPRATGRLGDWATFAVDVRIALESQIAAKSYGSLDNPVAV
jgi:hypothetical protein